MPEQRTGDNDQEEYITISSADRTIRLSVKDLRKRQAAMYREWVWKRKTFPPIPPEQAEEYYSLLNEDERSLWDDLEREKGREYVLDRFRWERNDLDQAYSLGPEGDEAYRKRQALGLEPSETPSEQSETSSRQPETQPRPLPTQRKQQPTPRKPSSPRPKKSGVGASAPPASSSQTSKAPRSGPTPESPVKPYVESSKNLPWKSQEDPQVTKDFEDLFRSQPPLT